MRRLGGRFNTRDEADLKLEGASSFSKEDARVLGGDQSCRDAIPPIKIDLAGTHNASDPTRPAPVVLNNCIRGTAVTTLTVRSYTIPLPSHHSLSTCLQMSPSILRPMRPSSRLNHAAAVPSDNPRWDLVICRPEAASLLVT